MISFLGSASGILIISIGFFSFTSSACSETIRKEYSGKDNVPDHIIFAFSLRLMATRYEDDQDFALTIVRDNMKIGSTEQAELFLQQMLAAGENLKKTNDVMEYAVLCQDNSLRSKSSIYHSMDSLDDARMANARYAYVDFKKTLNPEQKKYFKVWLDDMKEGYSYTAFDHASMFEKSEMDVKKHLQEVCASYAVDNGGAEK